MQRVHEGLINRLVKCGWWKVTCTPEYDETNGVSPGPYADVPATFPQESNLRTGDVHPQVDFVFTFFGRTFSDGRPEHLA
jgi:hypothetical protein